MRAHAFLNSATWQPHITSSTDFRNPNQPEVSALSEEIAKEAQRIMN